MVPFGGYLMPVQYSDKSITDSHHWTREKASLFDVSHMLQHRLGGPGAADFLARITPSSPKALQPFHSNLTAILHPSGGIVDDSILTNVTEGPSQEFYFVTNAGCREKDLSYLKAELDRWNEEYPSQRVTHSTLGQHGLIALQGPLAGKILQSINPLREKGGKPLDLDELYFGQCVYAHISPAQRCLISRGGYTGEDGFEISIPPALDSSSWEHPVVTITKKLLDTAGKDKLRLAGLGARDSLRLEAGMCLYGHDIDDDTTPVEAALSWIIGKDRRENGGFLGDGKILQQLKPAKDGGGVSRRRVGLLVNDPAPAREGAEIVDADGTKVGVVTSGGPSPTLGKNIAMGYVKNGLHKAGTELTVVVRKKARPAVVTKMPFVPVKYRKGP